MKFQMTESKFGVPSGIYLGKFLGVKEMQNTTPRLGRDGRPMEPGIEWQWEITDDPGNEGAYVGRIASRITAAMPTTKNSCGALLVGVIGRSLEPGEEADVTDFVGQTYQVVVDPSKENPEKTQVIKVTRVNTGKPKNGAPKPPPRKPAPARFWVQTEAEEPVSMDLSQLANWIQENQLDPSQVSVCKEGTEEWKFATDFGVKDEIPF